MRGMFLLMFLHQLQRWAMHHRFEQPHFLLTCLLCLELIWKVQNEHKFRGKQFNRDLVVVVIKTHVDVYASVLHLGSPPSEVCKEARALSKL